MSSPRPPFSAKDAERIVLDVYGIDGTASEMPSYDDRNFKISAGSKAYTFKISMAGESAARLDLQDQVMQKLSVCSFEVPSVVPTSQGGRIAKLVISSEEVYLARLLTFIPGTMVVDVRPQPLSFLRDIGIAMGEVASALDGFEHVATEREFAWDLLQAHGFVTPSIISAIGTERAKLLECIAPRFNEAFFAKVDGLRKSIVHNDANDRNMLAESTMSGQHVSGLFDFGDTMQTATVADIAITAAYCAMNQDRPLNAVAEMAAGFHSVFPLLAEELELLFDLVCLRLCTSACFGAEARVKEPDNVYISVHEEGAWRLIEIFASTSHSFAYAMLRHACGFDPHPETTRAIEWVKENPDQVGGITVQDLSTAPVSVLDLTPGSLELAAPLNAWHSTESDAVYGIGRYAEPRLIYKSDAFQGDGERRTVHIGFDVGGPAGTPVTAPLDGTYEAFGFNDEPFDYGPTIILRHKPEDGTTFFTLYGHLSTDSLKNFEEGKAVKKGEVFARYGEESENGGWPPHVHFQILPSFFAEMDMYGNFPGVAYASEIELWKKLCPDPNIFCCVPQGLLEDKSLKKEEVISARRQNLSPSLSLSYRNPLKIVKGEGAYLFDESGKQYLDCVNNVCHVGHCHPKVVEAGQRQMAVLNTNTRYLHDAIARYSEQLLSKFPEELDTVFFVNSGSEANELALRLARSYTGAQDVAVIDGAYHGNTSAMIDLSPYKFNGAGGNGKPEHVHVLPMPDPYRKTDHSYDLPKEQKLAAVFAESILGCGGQIVLPEGYLKDLFAQARKAGALCVADEVQTGFGRVGSHFWAFETQDVIPDIVTLGKPMGNGHPLAAVVTKREIAEKFANGVEYFNTFGGNPVSCAIGAAMLDVIKEDNLQKNAQVVGAHLLQELKKLKEKHTLIGDIRGLGLFIGVELVRDHQTLDPAAEEADYIINRLREMGVLVSTDGPLHNVLKIKPPIVFSMSDADRLLSALDEVLHDTCLTK